MNKTTIEWCNYTWNPITGCLHPCRFTYCYNTIKSTSVLNRFGSTYIDRNGKKKVEPNWRSRQSGKCHTAKKGEIYPYGYDPTYYPHRLTEPLKVWKPARIFTVDTGDMFGRWVPDVWIWEIMDVIKRCPQHTFQLLTKNPKRLLGFKFPNNVWIGTSVNDDKDKPRADILKKVNARVKFLSIEPLLGGITFDFKGLQWIIIGAKTGKKPAPPKTEWVDTILEQAIKSWIPVFTKSNLKSYHPIFMQQFPL